MHDLSGRHPSNCPQGLKKNYDLNVIVVLDLVLVSFWRESEFKIKAKDEKGQPQLRGKLKYLFLGIIVDTMEPIALCKIKKITSPVLQMPGY